MSVDPIHAFEFVERIAGLDRAEAVIAELLDHTGRYGFDVFVVGELPRLGEPALPSFFIANWSEQMRAEYAHECIVADDPSVAAARTRALPVMWSELKAPWRASGRSMRAFELTETNGFPEGIAIPVHGPNGYRGLVTLAGANRDVAPRERAALHMIGLYLHERLKEMLAPQPAARPAPRPVLTRGEIDCIQWLLAGKSDWEIGEILNISQATAHWRIEQAKKKFGVKTRAQLTALAVHHGYVCP